MSGSPSKITAADYNVVRSLATTQAVAERFGVSLSTAHKHRKRAAAVQPVAAARPADSAAAASAHAADAWDQRRPERASRGDATRQPLSHGGVERDRGRASAHNRVGAAASGHGPPLTLEPFSPAWAAWYSVRRLRSEIDLLNDNDARRGIIPAQERRARERQR
jgi:hypothetical protein